MSKRGGDLIREAPRIWIIIKAAKTRMRFVVVGERWARWDLAKSFLRFLRKMMQKINTAKSGIRISAKL